MKDLVKYFKMMKYALQAKMIFILAIIFFVLGLLFEFGDFSDHNSSYSLSCLYLALTAMYFYQLVFSTTVSKLVQSSPMKKKLQTVGPAAVTLITSLLTFTVYVVIRLIRITPQFLEDNGTTYANAYSTILFMAVWYFLFSAYLSISYKSYIISIVIVAVSVIAVLVFGSTTDIFINITDKLLIGGSNPVLLIAVSLGIILIGSLVGYVISLLLYKMPISDMAVRYALRQASK
ncbi:MAG: hypothetical protein K6A45_04890 [Lachnospiraceae bacterium]|nr:hypothetical protein [Lachnospiraceae bacterium]